MWRADVVAVVAVALGTVSWAGCGGSAQNQGMIAKDASSSSDAADAAHTGSGGSSPIDAASDAPGGADLSIDKATSNDAADGTSVSDASDARTTLDTSGASDATSPADSAAGDGSASNDARDAGAVDATTTDARANDGPVVVTDASTSDAPVKLAPWPGANAVAIVDNANVFGMDLSGLFYEPATATPTATPAILWGVDNGDFKLYQLTWNGTLFVPVTTNGWSAGKALKYPSGSGSPDCEGVTKAEWDSSIVYIAAEHDGTASSTSRMSILRYDTSGGAATLKATHEWNLTPDLPVVDANKGTEAITWIPDSELVAKGFLDESTGAAYAPANYTDHGTGVFFVGVENTGMIYAYTLNHTASTFHRVATIVSGLAGTMDLSFDRDVGTLWSACDEFCNNQITLLDIDTTVGSATRGKYRVRAWFDHPSTLPNAGNEGIAIGHESECTSGRKPFFWADDSNTANHAIRRDSIPCGRLY